MRKISFDFDGCLSSDLEVQEYCKECLKNPELEVYITTRRYSPDIAKLSLEDQPLCEWWKNIGDKNWLEVFELADSLGIKRENIHFCNMKNKWVYLETTDIYLHLDDDIIEVCDINDYCNTFSVCNKIKDWKQKCIELLNQK